MPKVVPLIRAAALSPLIRWLLAKGRPVEALLGTVDLASALGFGPMQPIPLVSAAAFLRLAASLEGPDVSCRVVSETSTLELMLLGKVALGARSPHEALTRIALALPFFCTHEHLSIDKKNKGVLAREFFTLRFDPVTLHLMHQYAAAMMKAVCGMTSASEPLLARIEIAPHPEFGLDHLRRWFGDVLVPTRLRTLNVFIEKNVVDRPFPARARDRMAAGIPAALTPLRGGSDFASSVRGLIATMLEGGPPTVERLSRVAGMSVRTFQRRLVAEATTFSALLDDVRRTQALQRLTENSTSLKTLSAELGYARQSALTRAVRRWTGKPPRHLRLRDTK